MNKLIIYLLTVVAILVWVGVYFVLSGQQDTNTQQNITRDNIYDIRITNFSDYKISRGVLVSHSEGFSMSFLGSVVSPEYVRLAEAGDPSKVIALLEANPEVYGIIKTDAISSGDSTTVSVAGADKTHRALSFMAMIDGIDGGVAWLNGVLLYGENDRKVSSTYLAEVLEVNAGAPVEHHAQFHGDSATQNARVQFDLIPQENPAVDSTPAAL